MSVRVLVRDFPEQRLVIRQHCGLEIATVDRLRTDQLHAGLRFAVVQLNIPACEYRESGKMETAIPAKWKPVIGAPIM